MILMMVNVLETKQVLPFLCFYCQRLASIGTLNKQFRKTYTKFNGTAMNAKISVFLICVEAITCFLFA